MTVCGCHDLDPGWTNYGYLCEVEQPGYMIIFASTNIGGQCTSGCFSRYIKGFANLSANSRINAVGS